MGVLIRNARIVTGDGVTPPFLGDALIEDDVIAALGAVDLSQAQTADRVIDAKGRALAPGFVDTHNHGALGGTALGASGLPVAFAPPLVARVESVAKEFGLAVKRLPSGAGHDAQMLAAVCPACMIFVPSAGGVSHNIEEYTSPDDLAAGAAVLLRLVSELAD